MCAPISGGALIASGGTGNEPNLKESELFEMRRVKWWALPQLNSKRNNHASCMR